MGWSCTQQQHETLERLDAEVRKSGVPYFIEHPTGGPNGRDYGTPEAMSMCLPVFRIIEMQADGTGRAHKVGYARIKPDGRTSIPLALRQALESR